MDYDPNNNISLYVDPYEYRPDGKGVPILAGGGTIIASVRGTNYPCGSACESDVALARKMAAGPELLAALEYVRPLLKQSRALNTSEIADLDRLLAKAKGQS